MDKLDPDDPRPPYQQVANALRAAILTQSLEAGEQLPSGAELARRYGVARMTIQQAIRMLRDEGLVVARQGSGTFVRSRIERPVSLRPILERAFEQRTITVDFAGFSGETLHTAIAEPLDKIRAGRLRPDSLTVRLLVPDPSLPWSLPVRVGDLADSPEFRARARGIMERHSFAVVDAVNELAALGLIPKASAQVRIYPGVPLFKLYIINGTETFFGYYPIREHVVELDGQDTAMWDLMGKDAELFHDALETEVEARGSHYVRESRAWFDSLWTSVARELKS